MMVPRLRFQSDAKFAVPSRLLRPILCARRLIGKPSLFCGFRVCLDCVSNLQQTCNTNLLHAPCPGSIIGASTLYVRKQ